MPIAKGYSDAELKARDAAIVAQNTSKSGRVDKVSKPPIYTMDKLEIPAYVPTSPVPTASAGMLAGLETNADQFTKDLAEKRKATETDKGSSLQELINSLGETNGITTATDKAYSSTVDPLEAELSDINSQILSEQESTRRRVERLKENTGGLFGGALEQEIGRIEDESLSRQADMAVIQLSRQGKYDSAKKIADRAVAAQMERQSQKNEILKYIYEENKALFTIAEQREFETQQSDRERELGNKEYRLRAEYDQKIAQADPLYKLQMRKAQKELDLLGEPTAKEKAESANALKEAQASIPVMQDKINAVELLKTHFGKGERVGANIFTRGTKLPLIGDPNLLTLGGSGEDFAGGIHKLVGGLTIDNLQAAKARGATFGALSDAELMLLANSASAIADWEIKDGKGNGRGYWDIDESSFDREMDTIKTLTQRAIVQSGGSLIADDEEAILNELFNVSNTSPASFYNNP